MSPDEIKAIIETLLENKLKYFWIYIIFAIIINLFGLFIIEFFREKGKNFATKGDIELLTSKVESVKYDYLKKIEEYKRELNIKYELEKTVINSKIEAYKLATSLKVTILKRKSNLGSEQELMQQLFDKIPELLIHLHSQIKLRNEFHNETISLENYYNNLVGYIEHLRNTDAKKYKIDFDEIEKIIDKIQEKILD